MVDSSFMPAGVEHFGALCAKLRSCQGKVHRAKKSLMTILWTKDRHRYRVCHNVYVFFFFRKYCQYKLEFVKSINIYLKCIVLFSRLVLPFPAFGTRSFRPFKVVQEWRIVPELISGAIEKQRLSLEISYQIQRREQVFFESLMRDFSSNLWPKTRQSFLDGAYHLPATLNKQNAFPEGGRLHPR